MYTTLLTMYSLLVVIRFRLHVKSCYFTKSGNQLLVDYVWWIMYSEKLYNLKRIHHKMPIYRVVK